MSSGTLNSTIPYHTIPYHSTAAAASANSTVSHILTSKVTKQSYLYFISLISFILYFQFCLVKKIYFFVVCYRWGIPVVSRFWSTRTLQVPRRSYTSGGCPPSAELYLLALRLRIKLPVTFNAEKITNIFEGILRIY